MVNLQVRLCKPASHKRMLCLFQGNEGIRDNADKRDIANQTDIS